MWQRTGCFPLALCSLWVKISVLHCCHSGHSSYKNHLREYQTERQEVQKTYLYYLNNRVSFHIRDNIQNENKRMADIQKSSLYLEDRSSAKHIMGVSSVVHPSTLRGQCCLDYTLQMRKLSLKNAK